MRVTAKLAERISKLPMDEHVHVIIKMRMLEKELIEELIKRPSVSIRHVIKMANAVSLLLPAGHIEGLSQEPWVERIEDDEKVYAVVDESEDSFGAPIAQRTGYTGKGVTLAVIDTGIDTDHPDFAGRIVATKDFTLEGFKDSNGHGSHVAGIAAGSGIYSDGKYKGIAPDAFILAGKVLQADGSGRASDVMAAVEWAVDLGADIVNLSLGSSGSSDGTDTLCELCDMAVAAGVVVCIAAGNDGPARRTIGSPAAARMAITVGAATANGLVAEFSSRGPTADDRLKPEVVAPGVDIVSVRGTGTRAGKQVDTHYTSATGTSMATSHVSGTIALLLEANKSASPQLIREALLHTASNLELDDYAQGAGMVAVDEALRYVEMHENPQEPVDQSPPRSALLSILSEAYGSLAMGKKTQRRPRRQPFLPPETEMPRVEPEVAAEDERIGTQH
ncbi:MAG: S8 family peptidase [Candidatus Aquicultor sp.]